MKSRTLPLEVRNFLSLPHSSMVAGGAAVKAAQPQALPRQPMKPPIALWLLISTLACNKASPLGASLYNTYKNNNIPTGAGVGAGAYAYAREIFAKTLSLY